MEKRIALIGIMFENKHRVEEINTLLHEASSSIIGRMGLPRVEKNTHVISIVIKATQKEISSLTGKLGNLKDVQCKTIYGKVIDES